MYKRNEATVVYPMHTLDRSVHITGQYMPTANSKRLNPRRACSYNGDSSGINNPTAALR